MKRTYYIKRKGALVFWRVGRIGGSFYLAKSKHKEFNRACEAMQVVSHGSEFRGSYYTSSEATNQPSLLS
jgi:hypothetical protein